MKMKRMSDSHYLLVKLTTRYQKLLARFKKCENTKTIKSTDGYLSDMLAIHLQSIFVMHTGLSLMEKGIIDMKTYLSALSELDESLNNFGKVINKYFVKFGDLHYSKRKKKKKKTKVI